jgi:23S rRNA (cytosine1962-C5)-methyltransferase
MSGSVAELRSEGEVGPGAWVRVTSSRGQVLGYGDFSPMSSIRVRMLAFGATEPPDELAAERIARAVARRQGDPLVGETDAVRLVNAEGDGLPGLIVDRYQDVVVVKLSSAGMVARRDLIAATLREVTGAPCGFERADANAARREGLPSRSGALWGEAPSGPVPIRERERSFQVDVEAGQKTGFYLDQRDSRDWVARCAEGRRVLDLFSYTGGFAVAAARGGASSVTLVDSSRAALDRAREHLTANAPGTPAVIEKADAFSYLRQSSAEAEAFDLLVVDPPPLARRRSDVSKASRAYKDLLLHAIRRAAPGARLLVFACSHHVGPDLFAKILFGASLDAGRPLRQLANLGAPADHPVSVDHPEGRYLTGLLFEVDETDAADETDDGA